VSDSKVCTSILYGIQAFPILGIQAFPILYGSKAFPKPIPCGRQAFPNEDDKIFLDSRGATAPNRCIRHFPARTRVA
jgi:hypothetical protein